LDCSCYAKKDKAVSFLQCHSDRREGTKEGNEEEEIFHYVQNDKSVGGVFSNNPAISPSAFWAF